MAFLVHDFWLTPEEALGIIGEWNAKCVPPWSIDDLADMARRAERLPGTRGEKLLPQVGDITRRQREDLSWLSQVQIDLPPLVDIGCGTALPGYQHRPAAAGSILTPAELAGLAASVTEAHHARVTSRSPCGGYYCDPDMGHIDYDHALAGPVDDDDDFDDDDGDPPPIEPAERPQCNCCFRVLQYSPQRGAARVVIVPGRRWDCPSCRPRRIAQYHATIRHWLGEWDSTHSADAERTLWVATVPAKDWPRIGSSIRVRHGSFFRLMLNAMGEIKGESYLVVSTVRTTHLDWQPISATDAAIRLCDTISAMPQDLRTRVWWSSRSWPLLPDRDPSEKWGDSYGRLRCSWTQIVEVLEAWGLQLKPVQIQGRWWTAQGREFAVPHGQWDLLRQDLDDGAPLSRFTAQLGLDPRAPFPASDGAAEDDFGP